MVRLLVDGKKIIGDFSEEQLKELELQNGTALEISKVKKGVYVLLEVPAEKKPIQVIDALEQKILGYLKTKHPKDLVEGNFEKTLSKEELQKFHQMLTSGVIEKFKTDPKYIKFVYRMKKNPNANVPKALIAVAKNFVHTEKPAEEFSLENDGFVVTKNDGVAQRLSNELSAQIKEGQIKGTRSFTGYYYIIESGLLEHAKEKVLSELRKTKTASNDEICQKTTLIPTLARIACAFLGEEGTIIEKRKDFYQLVE